MRLKILQLLWSLIEGSLYRVELEMVELYTWNNAILKFDFLKNIPAQISGTIMNLLWIWII